MNETKSLWEAGWDAKSKEAAQAEAARKLTEHKAACFDDLLAACKKAHAMMDSMDETDARCTTGFGYVEDALFEAIAKAERS